MAALLPQEQSALAVSNVYQGLPHADSVELGRTNKSGANKSGAQKEW